MKILILLFVLLNTNVQAQVLESALQACPTIQELEAQIGLYRTNPEQDLLEKTVWTKRDIGFGFQQYRNWFSIEYPNGKARAYDITCLILDDSVRLGCRQIKKKTE